MAVSPLPEQLRRVAPVVLAADRIIPVPEVFDSLIPGGGLQRGWITRVEGGVSARALAWGLLAEVTTAGGWIAAVDVAGIGLAAARELGVAIERVLVVSNPDPGAWSATLGALVGAVDVIVFDSPRHRVTPSEHRRLASRARERGSVLMELATSVRPTRLRSQLQYDLDISVNPVGWEGLGKGYGRLLARELEATVSGRRTAGPPRSARFEVPGVDGSIRRVDPIESAVVVPLR